MDVLIIPEARREISTWLALRPKSGTWGTIIGHRRGSRYIVEKVLAGGDPGTAPDERLMAELEKVWPGGIIGIIALKPGATFTKALLGPAWYGKVVVRAARRGGAPVLRSHVVEFDRRFHFDPAPLVPAAKEGPRE